MAAKKTAAKKPKPKKPAAKKTAAKKTAAKKPAVKQKPAKKSAAKRSAAPKATKAKAAKAAKPAAKATKATAISDVDTQLAQTAKDLAAALVAARGNETAELTAMGVAITRYMSVLGVPDGIPGEHLCAEFFAEGSTKSPPIFELMGDVDDDEQNRLWQLLGDAAGY